MLKQRTGNGTGWGYKPWHWNDRLIVTRKEGFERPTVEKTSVCVNVRETCLRVYFSASICRPQAQRNKHSLNGRSQAFTEFHVAVSSGEEKKTRRIFHFS